MTGLVYKEWKQNRLLILSMILCGSAPVIALLLIRSEIHDISDAHVRIGGLIAGLLAAGALQMLVLRGDDRRLWSYWITATPGGYREFLRVKYEMIFGMIVLFMFTVKFVDMGFCAAAADMGKGDMMQISGAALPLCFVQILFRAIDIPFVYRFGSKKGSYIKLICMLAGSMILAALLLLNMEHFDAVAEVCIKIFNVKNSPLILSAGLAVCPALYYLSYRITCNLYLKGAEHYDR